MRLLKLRFIIGIILFVLIAGTVSFFVTGKTTDVQKTGQKYKEFKIERGIFQVVVSANVIVKPIDRIEIKSKASGEIEELPVVEGDFVQSGELIARLDQKDERAEVAQAQADLDIAKAELKQAQSTFDRRNQLFQSNLISEEEQDQIELGLAVARGKLIQAKTSLESAKERLSESVVRAPINGIILQKYVEKGQIIASGVSNVSGGTKIVDIADMSSVYIEAGIDEIDIGKIQAGQTAVVVAEAYPEFKLNGTIIRIAPEAKIEQNVTLFDVIIEVGNSDGKLKSGMNTDIEILIMNKGNILIIPTITLQALTGAETQLNEREVLLKQGSEFVPHKVKIGLSHFKQTEVVSGLTEGDILGVPMTSRLKEENERLEERLKKNIRSIGVGKQQKTR